MSSEMNTGIGRLGPMRVPVAMRTAAAPLAAAYLLLACIAAAGFLLLVPPFKAPDEPNHFLRICQLAAGELFGDAAGPAPGPGGGVLDSAPNEMTAALDPVPAARPNPPEVAATVRSLAWGRPPIFLAFPNTVIYPPFFYLPQVIGVRLGQAAGWTVEASYTLGRWGALGGSFALGALALWHARRGAVLIAVILGLPMTLFLAASVSQDGPLIASGALLAALLSRPAAEMRASPALRIGLGLLLAALALARPPYILLSLIILLPPWRAAFGGWRAILLPVLVLGLVLAWTGQFDMQVARWLRPGVDVDMRRQLAFLVREPSAVPHIIWATLLVDGPRLTREMMGVLGWLNIRLPDLAYWFGGAAILLAILATGAAGEDGLPPATRLGVLVLLVGVIGAMFGAQYLSWTPVGGGVVEGMQGRYLLPLLPLLILVVPPMPGIGRAAGVIGAVALAAGLVVMLSGLQAVAQAFG